MAVKAFSNEWAKAFKDEVNRSSVYKSAGKGWKGIVMDLFDGEARDIKVGPASDAQKCDFVITAPYTRWKEVATSQLDATKGMLQGKLKLKGDLPTIVRYTKASQEMTLCTTRIPVEWPDEK